MKISKPDTFIKAWLYTLVLMVFAMVFIGGVTRLTNSGLSMVEWKPLLGAIPPINEEQWLETFHKYQQFPQYKLVNHKMNLSEFKSIFFWEYFHRLFGRLIGITFFIPFVLLVIKKRLTRTWIKKLFIGFVLGGMQGLMGWYMVKSGLVERPEVSHFRLAAHLLLAFFIMSYLYWLTLEIKYPGRLFSFKNPLRNFMLMFSVFVFFQFLYGAFVAGLDAGLTHNTFPKMGHRWIPLDVVNLKIFDLIDHKVVVQFVHRVIGFFLLGLSLILFYKRKHISDHRLRESINALVFMVFIQFGIGVVTLLFYVKIEIASLHQIGAAVLLLLLVRTLFFTYKTTAQV